jgi:arginine repressor
VGAASPVAVVLDHEMGKVVAGTIAGDDTVFVAVRSRSDQGRAVAQINVWIRQGLEP